MSDKCPKCGMMRFYKKVDSEPAKFCGGCGHSFANEEQAELARVRELPKLIIEQGGVSTISKRDLDNGAVKDFLRKVDRLAKAALEDKG